MVRETACSNADVCSNVTAINILRHVSSNTLNCIYKLDRTEEALERKPNKNNIKKQLTNSVQGELHNTGKATDL